MSQRGNTSFALCLRVRDRCLLDGLRDRDGGSRGRLLILVVLREGVVSFSVLGSYRGFIASLDIECPRSSWIISVTFHTGRGSDFMILLVKMRDQSRQLWKKMNIYRNKEH